MQSVYARSRIFHRLYLDVDRVFVIGCYNLEFRLAAITLGFSVHLVQSELGFVKVLQCNLPIQFSETTTRLVSFVVQVVHFSDFIRDKELRRQLGLFASTT